MTINHSRLSNHIITLSGAVLFAASSFFVSAGPANAMDNDYGLSSCILYDGEKIGPDTCCWEEPPDENGDSLGFCIKCKGERMADCDVIDDPRGISAPRGGGLPKGDGTISEPRPKPGPKIKLDRPKNGEVLR